jgi:hypothetical protein
METNKALLQRIADDARAGHKNWQQLIAELAEHLLGKTNTVPPPAGNGGWKPV